MPNRRRRPVRFLSCLLATALACLALPALAQDAPPSAADLQKALAQLQQMQQQAGAKGDPVDFHELKKLLPEKLLGLPRTEASGSRSGMMGMKVSEAEAEYGQGGKTITLTIVDAIATPLGGAAAWAMLGDGYEEENDDGWERVKTVGGHLLHESWSKSERTSTADMIIGKRFIVSVEVSGAEPGEALAALREVDVDALEKLASAGK